MREMLQSQRVAKRLRERRDRYIWTKAEPKVTPFPRDGARGGFIYDVAYGADSNKIYFLCQEHIEQY
jgi:hypothetical protein